MRFAMTGLALRHCRVLTAMTEGTGKRLVLGYCFLHLFTNLFMARCTESPRCGQGIIDLQRMMSWMATKTVAGYLGRFMWLMTSGTIGDLAVHLMTEGTGLLGMCTLIGGKILPRSLMACKAWLFYVIGKIQGKGLMGIGMAGKAVLQFKMGPALMTHGTFRNNIFSPGGMLTMAIETGYCCLMHPAVTGN
jgi:hypothetical protein